MKKIATDKELIIALQRQSQKKEDSSKRLALDDTTTTSIITLLYDSLRELLEALASKKGCVHSTKRSTFLVCTQY